MTSKQFQLTSVEIILSHLYCISGFAVQFLFQNIANANENKPINKPIELRWRGSRGAFDAVARSPGWGWLAPLHELWISQAKMNNRSFLKMQDIHILCDRNHLLSPLCSKCVSEWMSSIQPVTVTSVKRASFSAPRCETQAKQVLQMPVWLEQSVDIVPWYFKSEHKKER